MIFNYNFAEFSITTSCGNSLEAPQDKLWVHVPTRGTFENPQLLFLQPSNQNEMMKYASNVFFILNEKMCLKTFMFSFKYLLCIRSRVTT